MAGRDVQERRQIVRMRQVVMWLNARKCRALFDRPGMKKCSVSYPAQSFRLHDHFYPGVSKITRTNVLGFLVRSVDREHETESAVGLSQQRLYRLRYECTGLKDRDTYEYSVRRHGKLRR
jgi:hypothetical protein